MTVTEAAEIIGATIVAAAADSASAEVRGGYASDLLSDVMANSREGDLWITLQKHINIIAIARLNGLAGIVLINGRKPEEATMARAQEERVTILCTDLQAFEVAGILYSRGVRGRRST